MHCALRSGNGKEGGGFVEIIRIPILLNVSYKVRYENRAVFFSYKALAIFRNLMKVIG